MDFDVGGDTKPRFAWTCQEIANRLTVGTEETGTQAYTTETDYDSLEKCSSVTLFLRTQGLRCLRPSTLRFCFFTVSANRGQIGSPHTPWTTTNSESAVGLAQRLRFGVFWRNPPLSCPLHTGKLRDDEPLSRPTLPREQWVRRATNRPSYFSIVGSTVRL